MRAFIKRSPVASFAVLAYAISWTPWFLSLATGRKFSGLFSFGPMLAAFGVAMVIGGANEVGRLGARLLRWRIGARWWLMALTIALAPLVLTVVGVPLLGGAPADPVKLAQWPTVLATFPVGNTLGGGWFFNLFARADIAKVVLVRVVVELTMAIGVIALAGPSLGLRPRRGARDGLVAPPTPV